MSSVSQELGVFRSFTAHRGPVVAGRAVDVARLIDAVRAGGLAVVLITVSLARPGPATAGARGTAIAVTLSVCGAAWVVWMLTGRWDRTNVAGLTVLGAAGGVLAGLSPNSPALAVGCVTVFAAGAALSPETSLGIIGETLAAFLITALVTGASAGILLGYSFAFVSLWTVGLTRRAYLLRAEQAEDMLAESRRAREAETQAAALAERARIARDIHDVLAHSLAAVSVNLQAAEGLLGAGTLPADNPELAKAIECIDRAGTLTREGLAAARRAVMALREDSAPLPDQLSALVEEYRAVGDLVVGYRVTGAVRPLPAKASMVAYRTATEALTNARKHAPGQPVTLRLGFEPAGVTVSVVNPLSPDGAQGPLAATGARYGLTGLTERAALAGGTFEAGPTAGNWHVSLRIPA
jgi:signal transduction histidine kinase